METATQSVIDPSAKPIITLSKKFSDSENLYTIKIYVMFQTFPIFLTF